MLLREKDKGKTDYRRAVFGGMRSNADQTRTVSYCGGKRIKLIFIQRLTDVGAVFVYHFFFKLFRRRGATVQSVKKTVGNII